MRAAGMAPELQVAEQHAGQVTSQMYEALQASSLAAVLGSSALISGTGSVLGSALAGSLCVGVLTPQRNAMTIAAKDTTSTYLGLYQKVFNRGLLGGFRGGFWPVIMAMPQFAAIGPVYHAAKDATSSALFATSTAAFAESLFTYAAQSRNAQIQYNATRSAGQHIPVMGLSWPFGPGFGFHVVRNVFAMMGIRIFSPYSLEAVKCLPLGLPREVQFILADLTSSVTAASLSMPFNHIFSWVVCTPELKKLSMQGRLRACFSFLYTNYSEQGARLLIRDMATRWSYTACLFTLYHALERQVLAH